MNTVFQNDWRCDTHLLQPDCQSSAHPVVSSSGTVFGGSSWDLRKALSLLADLFPTTMVVTSLLSLLISCGPKWIGCLNTKWASPITMEGIWKNTNQREALEEENQNWSREFPPKATGKDKTHLRINSSGKHRQAPLSAWVALTLEEQSGLLQCWVPQVYSQDMSGNRHFVTSISNDAGAGDWETLHQRFELHIQWWKSDDWSPCLLMAKVMVKVKKAPTSLFPLTSGIQSRPHTPKQGKAAHWAVNSLAMTLLTVKDENHVRLNETFQGNPRWRILRLEWIKPQKRYKLARLSLPQRLPTGDHEQEYTSQEGTETPQGRPTAPGP